MRSWCCLIPPCQQQKRDQLPLLEAQLVTAVLPSYRSLFLSLTTTPHCTRRKKRDRRSSLFPDTFRFTFPLVIFPEICNYCPHTLLPRTLLFFQNSFLPVSRSVYRWYRYRYMMDYHYVSLASRQPLSMCPKTFSTWAFWVLWSAHLLLCWQLDSINPSHQSRNLTKTTSATDTTLRHFL